MSKVLATRRDLAHALRSIDERGPASLNGPERAALQMAADELEALSLPDRFVPDDVPGYMELRMVIDRAYDQSARGKGRQRHNKANKPFLKQPIMEIGRMVGVGYQTGQIMKKVQEATTMHLTGNAEGAKAELLGAIVYAAAAYLLVEEQSPEEN